MKSDIVEKIFFFGLGNGLLVAKGFTPRMGMSPFQGLGSLVGAHRIKRTRERCLAGWDELIFRNQVESFTEALRFFSSLTLL